MDAEVFGYQSVEEFQAFVRSWRSSTVWPFMRLPSTANPSSTIEDLEAAFRDARIRMRSPSPQAFGVHRVVLHAFSGRRRPGDFQEYLEAMTKGRAGQIIHVASVDIVLDSVWGDVSSAETQKFWYHSVRQRYVIGYLAGPPCETWSQAREHPVSSPEADTGHAPGPRVLRTLDEIWGKDSLAIREVRQLLMGNQLLLFSLHILVVLYTVNGFGALEHPAPPSSPTSASIWRTVILTLLSSLPGFQQIQFAQGLLGARSAKPTMLLTLNLPHVAEHIPSKQSL